MADGPFDDELTPEEEALLRDESAVPPAEDEGEGTVEQAVAEAEAPAAIPPKDGAQQQPEGQQPAADQQPADQQPPPQGDAAAEDRALAAFLEKHKDKPPEELLRLAFQQSSRANRSEATNRQIRDSVSQLADRARAAAARRDQVAQQAPELLAQFKAKLAEDPDGATAWLFEQTLNRQVNEADAEAHVARIDEAIAFADTHIPNFGQQWPGMASLAKEVGYTDEELNGINDGRPLLVLSLANHTARLMKARIMDRNGNIDVSKLTQLQPVAEQPTDARLTAPTPQRTLGNRSSSTRGNASIEQQLQEILAMDDAQLSEFEAKNPGVIDNLLRQAA
jgi:hypothetical protein